MKKKLLSLLSMKNIKSFDEFIEEIDDYLRENSHFYLKVYVKKHFYWSNGSVLTIYLDGLLIEKSIDENFPAILNIEEGWNWTRDIEKISKKYKYLFFSNEIFLEK